MSRLIHFICEGNTFRSRFAEAYAKSINKKRDISFISSGIEANLDEKGSLAPYGKYIIDKYRLQRYNKANWTQTTQELINKSDVLVFMNDDVYRRALQMYDFNNKKQVNWHILDLEPFLIQSGKNKVSEKDKQSGSFKISQDIKKRIDELLK